MNWEALFYDVTARVSADGGISDIFVLGGPVVVLLLAMSVVMLAVALLKLAQFVRAGVGRHGAADHAVAAWIAGRGAPSALRRGATLSQDVVAQQIAAGADTEIAREVAESFAAMRLHHLRKFVGLIDAIAQIAPLLGLFGTVLGMIEAFQALEGAGSAVDPSVLAGGIWVALLTTAVGLAVAMPAYVIASWFDARLENERMALDRLISRLATGTGDPAPAVRHPGASIATQRQPVPVP